MAAVATTSAWAGVPKRMGQVDFHRGGGAQERAFLRDEILIADTDEEMSDAQGGARSIAAVRRASFHARARPGDANHRALHSATRVPKAGRQPGELGMLFTHIALHYHPTPLTPAWGSMLETVHRLGPAWTEAALQVQRHGWLDEI